ncbi:MAG: hypothetical protein JNK55_01045 [Rubrivivax sp.]|nr:hypothetical protein [Rubrivivax sp.]
MASQDAASFSDEQRSDLKRLGVTEPQIRRLLAALPHIETAMLPAEATAPVRDALKELRESLERVQRIMCAPDQQDSVDRQAARWMEWLAQDADIRAMLDGTGEGALVRQYLARFTQMLPAILKLAHGAELRAPKKQSRGMRSAAAVVELILDALAVPPDDESARLAASAAPVRGDHSKGTKNPFPAIARLCIEAATGDHDRDLAGLLKAWRKWRPGALAIVARKHGHSSSKN